MSNSMIAPQYEVSYRTATQVSKVSNDLAGAFNYYADPNDAFDTGLMCVKCLTPVYDLSRHEVNDLLGKPYKIILKDNLTKSDMDIIRKS